MKLKSLNVSIGFVLVSLFLSWPLGAQDVPRITKEELKGMLGHSDVIVIDARLSQNWQDSEFKIKGAIRGHPGHFGLWADQFPKDKTLILY